MDCKTCKELREPAPVAYLVHESAMARMERIIKKQWIVILLLIALLVGSNFAWLYYESQFETVENTTTTQEVTQEAENGTNNFVGGDVNGKADSQDDNN